MDDVFWINKKGISVVTYRKMCIKSGCVVVVGIMDFSKNEGFSKSTY